MTDEAAGSTPVPIDDIGRARSREAIAGVSCHGGDSAVQAAIIVSQALYMLAGVVMACAPPDREKQAPLFIGELTRYVEELTKKETELANKSEEKSNVLPFPTRS